MKILAFSDWRKQPLDLIKGIIKKHKPDTIFYAGDDLKRIVANNKDLFIKISDKFIKLDNKKSDIFISRKVINIIKQKAIMEKVINANPAV
ncbi:MAG: hypothetical protein WC755_08335 [Candidatus Woesearchaeota archaeon]|jgi:hypothetical protein